jgi:hypothetical protein
MASADVNLTKKPITPLPWGFYPQVIHNKRSQIFASAKGHYILATPYDLG